MDYLKSIDPATRKMLQSDVQAHLNRAHFICTIIPQLKPLFAAWGTRVMTARFLNALKPEVMDLLTNSLVGAMHRAQLEYWYLGGDKNYRVTGPDEYVVALNFRYRGDDTWGPGGHRRQNAPGDLRLDFRFPGLLYSNEAFDDSTQRTLEGATTQVRLLSDLVEDEGRLDELVKQYNCALAILRAACSEEYAQCYPVSAYLRSGQL